MKFFTIRIANTNIGIRAEFHRSYRLLQDFVVDEEPDFTVQCSVEDFDREAAEVEATYQIDAPTDVHLEVSALLRKISEHLLSNHIFLIHGAAIALDGQAYLFAAPSGVGKTTHILKWLDHCPDAFVVNGDKPFILVPTDKGQPLVCGSPWSGKENMYTNTTVPLKSIILMERSEDNHMEQISFAEAFPSLFQQVYRPDEPEKMQMTLHLLQTLTPSVSFWRFQCNNFKEECFQVAYSALHGSSS